MAANVEAAAMQIKDFGTLRRFIYDTCGITITDTKKAMLEARLQKRLRVLGMESYSGYCKYLFSPEGLENELVHMLDVVTTNKTDFFREADHFHYLTHKVLPEWWLKQTCGRLSVWSAGCSTGEEPYTLAMVLAEFAQAHSGFDFQILATDLSSRVLAKAAAGIYPEGHAEPIPLALKKKYLLRNKDRSKGTVRIVPDLCRKIEFRRLNFMDEDFAIGQGMDIIFCRNVIIYFDRPTQQRLMQRFYRQMKKGALLFLGHSETLTGLDVPLVKVRPTVYQKPR